MARTSSPDTPTLPSRQPSERMQRRMADTRRAIMEAALDLFGELPYREVTIAKITSRAGCAVGTFYGFFQDKEDLIMQAARERMAQANGFLAQPADGANARQRIAGLMHGAAEVIAEDMTLYLLFSTFVAGDPDVAKRYDSHHAERSHALVRSLVAAGQAEGTLRADVDADIVADLLQGCLASSRGEAAGSFVGCVDAKVSLVLDGLASPSR